MIFSGAICALINLISCANSLTSSAGRLFDGISSLLNLVQINRFEGEAAMSLEFSAKTSKDKSCYPMPVDFSVTPNITDGRPMLAAIMFHRPLFPVKWQSNRLCVLEDILHFELVKSLFNEHLIGEACWFA